MTKKLTNYNKLINDYLKIRGEYYKYLKYNTEEYKIINKLAKKILKIDTIILENKNFLEIYKDIFINNIQTLGGIALKISIFEPKLGKKLYLYWYNLDRESNFSGKYILDDWDKNLLNWKKGKENYIELYNKWKEENKDEYEKIIKEINVIIDNYEG